MNRGLATVEVDYSEKLHTSNFCIFVLKSFPQLKGGDCSSKSFLDLSQNTPILCL